MDAMQSPTQDAMPAEEPQELLCVYLAVMADGSFKVSTEKSDEATEPPMEGTSEPADSEQSYDSIEDAIAAVRTLAQPQDPADDMQKGFDSVAETAPNGPFQRGMS